MREHSVACALATLLLLTGPVARAQVKADEHQQHHPGEQPGSAPANPSSQMPQGMGGMGQTTQGGGMGQMMEGMHQPPSRELYPSLMSLPDLPLEKRQEVQRQAHERMTAGTTLMSEGISKLSSTAQRADYAAMQEAVAQLRQGLAQFESGLATHRALAEGQAPRSVALQWFKKEMNFAPPQDAATPHGFFGLSWFHYFTMIVLLGFSATMIWMYFHKMKRTEVLVASLAGKQPVSAMAPGSERPRAEGPVASTAVAASAATGTSAAGATLAAAPAVEKLAVQATLPTGRWSGQLRVAKIFQETPSVKTLHLIHPAGGDLPFVFQPGQFLTVSVNVDGKDVKRSYSIASSPYYRASCELTVKREPGGVVSGFLHERVQAADLVAVSGPYGRFSFRGTEASSIVLIAGGVGVTPLMSAIRYLTDRNWPGEIFLLYGAPTLEDIIFRDELEYLMRRHANLYVTFVLSRETSKAWTGARGRIDKELLIKTVSELSTRRVHICGPLKMMDSMKSILAEIGVPSEQIKTEAFLGPEPKPSPAGAESQPSPPAVPAEPTVAAATAVCTFTRSGKSAPLSPDKTVLEASEDVGVNIDYSCREGWCGVCTVKLISGQVTMAVEDALTPEDKAAGIILACQAKSTGNIQVEA